MKINAFLPCKKQSQRIKNKNKKIFANITFGLIKIKLSQLIRSKLINKIYLSTDDQQIINFAKKLNNKKIIIHVRRDKNLSKNNTATQKLIHHAIEIIPDGHILWTHVTSPFINEMIYDKVIKKYKSIIKSKHDSLMTVTKIQGFVWDNKSSINYNSKKIKWPRTQDLKMLNKINSGIFLNSRLNYLRFDNRIGKNPYMYEISKFIGLDIDDYEDFKFAEFLFKNKKKYKLK